MATNKYGYMAKIGVDTTEMRQADSDMRRLSTELKDIDRLIAATGGTTELYAQRQAVLSQQISAVTGNLERLRNSQDAVRQAFEQGDISAEMYRTYQRDIENTQNSLENLQEQQRSLGRNAEKDFGKITNALKNIEKAALASSAAVAAALTKLSSDALAAYSQYEQLAGGVETLFSGAEDIVMKNAENAYKTAGISANSYMQTVTGFSATLLQGLGGDTKKAAEIADSALIDMADNANKMGTAMSSIQYAYQGFAKDNYTMLDNLKLGYGGTQSEMARLINDSGVLNGEMVATAENVKDIPFDKIIEAIHKIQENLGITGTTALEAETTLEGSMNKLKAAWENALVDIARPLDDFAMGGLTILNDNMDTIKETLVKLTEHLKPLLDDALEKLKAFIENGGIEKLSDQFIDLVEFVINNKETLLGLFAALEAALGAERMGKMISSFKDLSETIGNARTAIGSAGGQITIFGEECSVSAGKLGLYAAAIAAVAAAATAFVNSPAFDKMMNLFGVYVYEESDAQKQLEDTTAKIHDQRLEFEELAKTDPAAAFEKAKEPMNDLAHSYAQNTQRLQELRQLIASGAEETETGGFRFFDENEMRAMREEEAFLEYQNTEISALFNDRRDILNSYDAQTVRRLQETSAAQNQAIENAGRTNADALADVRDHIRATTKEKMDEFDHDLATHKIDDSQYWVQRKEYLEKHRDEENEQWWKWYDEVTEHYEKLSETEKKAAEQAAKDAQKEFEDQIQSRWEAAERTQKENGESDQWLADEYKKIVDDLEKGSDIYYKYYDKWLDKTVKISEDTKKAAQKQTDEEVNAWKKSADEVSKAVEKKHSDVQKAFEKAKGDYIAGLDLYSMEKDDSSSKVLRTAKAYQKDDKDEKMVLADINEQTKKLKEYRKNMKKLESTGIPSEYLEKIKSMNLDSRMEYVAELVKLRPEKLQKHYADINAYYKEAHLAGLDDTKDMKAEADSYATEAQNSILNSWESLNPAAYEAGKDAAKAYIDGFAKNMELTNSLMNITTLVPAKKSAVQQNTAYVSGGETQNAAALSTQYSAYEYTAPFTPVTVTINIAPQVNKVVNTTVDEIFSKIKNGGGKFDF